MDARPQNAAQHREIDADGDQPGHACLDDDRQQVAVRGVRIPVPLAAAAEIRARSAPQHQPKVGAVGDLLQPLAPDADPTAADTIGIDDRHSAQISDPRLVLDHDACRQHGREDKAGEPPAQRDAPPCQEGEAEVHGQEQERARDAIADHEADRPGAQQHGDATRHDPLAVELVDQHDLAGEEDRAGIDPFRPAQKWRPARYGVVAVARRQQGEGEPRRDRQRAASGDEPPVDEVAIGQDQDREQEGVDVAPGLYPGDRLSLHAEADRPDQRQGQDCGQQRVTPGCEAQNDADESETALRRKQEGRGRQPYLFRHHVEGKDVEEAERYRQVDRDLHALVVDPAPVGQKRGPGRAIRETETGEAMQGDHRDDPARAVILRIAGRWSRKTRARPGRSIHV